MGMIKCGEFKVAVKSRTRLPLTGGVCLPGPLHPGGFCDWSVETGGGDVPGPDLGARQLPLPVTLGALTGLTTVVWGAPSQKACACGGTDAQRSQPPASS